IEAPPVTVLSTRGSARARSMAARVHHRPPVLIALGDGELRATCRAEAGRNGPVRANSWFGGTVGRGATHSRRFKAAEGEGFEPSNEVNPRYTISNRARSTTPAPLQGRERQG